MTTSYSKQSLNQKFDKVTNSQQSIETLSRWIMFHDLNKEESVDTWLQYFLKANPEKKLTLFYLANDIMQNNRKKGGGFITCFSRILQKAITSLVLTPNISPKIINSVKRMIKIWSNRQLFGTEYVQNLLQAVDSPSFSSSSSSTNNHFSQSSEPKFMPRNNNNNNNEPKIPRLIKNTNLLKLFSKLEESSISDALVEERVNNLQANLVNGEIIKEFDNEENNKTSLDIIKLKLQQAFIVLEQFKLQMESDLETRTLLVTQISNLLDDQEEILNNNADKLTNCLEKLESLKNTKSLIEEKEGLSVGDKRTSTEANLSESDQLKKKNKFNDDNNNDINEIKPPMTPPLPEEMEEDEKVKD
eukprot:TRINITY_DN1441_c0_g2_i1.p1 TRINITY_DN1441_c0_g2~~TRINITY_DN1441_c0_g2_i1.p1  ORF type:complete len:359 (-),score=113.92 TRINITY_DN1441_c0_g2_i1:187-1263(-)